MTNLKKLMVIGSIGYIATNTLKKKILEILKFQKIVLMRYLYEDFQV